MSKQLKEIQKPVEENLKRFDTHFKEVMKSDVPLLGKITQYIVKRKGKQIRPLFVFLCARLHGKATDQTYVAASLIELLHTATLVHDDVVDDSMQRRGFFSINALWKNKIAVLVGDYFLSKGLLLALDNKAYQILHLVSDAVRKMSEGELLQIEKARRLDIEEDIYYQIIEKKTASLLAASSAAGTASIDNDEALVKEMWEFGEKIGMAFQIKDDLMDFGTDDIGKPRGIDIQEKKMTLPLIYALNKAPAIQRKKIISLIKRKSHKREKVNEVIAFVNGSGGIEYAQDIMYRYRDEAFEMLNKFPDSEAKTALQDLVNYVVDRKK